MLCTMIECRLETVYHTPRIPELGIVGSYSTDGAFAKRRLGNISPTLHRIPTPLYLSVLFFPKNNGFRDERMYHIVCRRCMVRKNKTVLSKFLAIRSLCACFCVDVVIIFS